MHFLFVVTNYRIKTRLLAEFILKTRTILHFFFFGHAVYSFLVCNFSPFPSFFQAFFVELAFYIIFYNVLSICFSSWLAECLGGESVPEPIELEEALRSGVLLAKLANYFAPELVAKDKIFDIDEVRTVYLKDLNFFRKFCFSKVL